MSYFEFPVDHCNS